MQTTVGGVTTNGFGKYLLAALVGCTMGPLLDTELSDVRADTAKTGLLENVDIGASRIDAWNVAVRGCLMGLKSVAEYSHDDGYSGISGLQESDSSVVLAANLRDTSLNSMDIEPAVRFMRFDRRVRSVPECLNPSNGESPNNSTLGVKRAFNPHDAQTARIRLNHLLGTNAFGDRRTDEQVHQSFTPANACTFNTLVLRFQTGF